MIGSMIVLDVKTRAEAESWAHNDPYAKAGLFDRVEIHPWKHLIGGLENPQAKKLDREFADRICKQGKPWLKTKKRQPKHSSGFLNPNPILGHGTTSARAGQRASIGTACAIFWQTRI